MNTEILGTTLLQLLVIIVLAKVAGWLCHKAKQSAVLGELLVGVLLGPSVLHFINPEASSVLIFLAELGVIILLFEVGLESNIYKLLRVGVASMLVALVGVILPFVGGYWYVTSIGATPLVALFIGATLTATSVGITMRIFSEVNKIDSTEGKIILGAAVIDDVLGLILLSIVVGVVELGKVSLLNVGKTSLLSILFLVGSIYVGIKAAPTLLKIVRYLEIKRTFAITAMIFALSLAYLANRVGLATIVGSFAAGLILETTEEKEHIREKIKPLSDVFVPFFFVHAGLLVNLALLKNVDLLIPALVLFVIAVIGKILSGAAAIRVQANKLLIGLGMIPRGEVGLIFATFGLTNNVIGAEMYALIVAIVMLTTFLAPPLLSWQLRNISEKENKKTNEEISSV